MYVNESCVLWKSRQSDHGMGHGREANRHAHHLVSLESLCTYSEMVTSNSLPFDHSTYHSSNAILTNQPHNYDIISHGNIHFEL